MPPRERERGGMCRPRLGWQGLTYHVQEWELGDGSFGLTLSLSSTRLKCERAGVELKHATELDSSTRGQ